MRDEGLCCQYVLAQKEYYFHLLLPCLAQGGYASLEQQESTLLSDSLQSFLKTISTF